MRNFDFEVIVVGAGHAGIEAALASARAGAKTLLTTNNLDRIGFMSCNPSIGGLGKGHMVKEIDILGGGMGVAADATCLQFKRLNSSRGPAVRGTRMQCDKDLYTEHMANVVHHYKNLSVLGLEVQSLIIENGKCFGIQALDGSRLYSRSVVITTGTFMNAVMHFGLKKIEGGRVGDKATIGISDQLRDNGFTVLRLKTGTPARADKNSIDWNKTQPQSGDPNFIPFSLRSKKAVSLPQIDCYLTYTNEKTHDIIRRNLDKSPMFCGVIEGIGPRYCPSIEDKVTRFADKERHQSFLEPEGLTTNSIYIQGMSTSLPEDVQLDYLRTMDGMENVRLLKPGYAVEYDVIEPTQIKLTLETRTIENLFLAGQINGTSGYEEAGAQGLIAGVNAAKKAFYQESFILQRHEAYTGVLIDDLITKGTKEPYRMMTSRAEHRLVLREDNTIERLAERARTAGLLSEDLWARYSQILSDRHDLRAELRLRKAVPNEETQRTLTDMGSAVLQKPHSLEELLRREEFDCSTLRKFGLTKEYDKINVEEAVEISVKYSGYVSRQNELIRQAQRHESTIIPESIDYTGIYGLSREEKEKLSKVRPVNIGQASRISGVNPSAVQALLIHMMGRARQKPTEGATV